MATASNRKSFAKEYRCSICNKIFNSALQCILVLTAVPS